MFNTLVFGGGGMRGLSYIGAYYALTRAHLISNIKYLAGSSIGGVMASLIAIGYTANELYDFVLYFD